MYIALLEAQRSTKSPFKYGHNIFVFINHFSMLGNVALLKAQVSLQIRKMFSSDNGVSVYIMHSYMY